MEGRKTGRGAWPTPQPGDQSRVKSEESRGEHGFLKSRDEEDTVPCACPPQTRHPRLTRHSRQIPTRGPSTESPPGAAHNRRGHPRKDRLRDIAAQTSLQRRDD